MSVYSYRVLPSATPQGRVYKVDTNSNHHADEEDPVLVQVTENGWQPVEQMEGSVDRFTLEQDYGYWRDTELCHEEGWPWNRRKVVDRPKDGEIQADEVSLTRFRRLRSHYGGPSNTFEIGGEIQQDGDGRLFLREHYRQYGPHRIITQYDIDDMVEYRRDDANWTVPTQQG